jgi:hypothetical protein
MSLTEQGAKNALLHLISVAVRGESLERLHHAIESEISACSNRIDDVAASGDEDCLEFATDEECEATEQLLGLAFVAAQSFITAFRTEVAKVARISWKKFGVKLSFTTDEKAYNIFRLSPMLPAAPTFSIIEAINAVANYWKHGEEWSTVLVSSGKWGKPVWDTASLRGNEKRTIEIVTALGLCPNSTGNLRTAAKALGVVEFDDLGVLRRVLRTWASDLKLQAATELAE